MLLYLSFCFRCAWANSNLEKKVPNFPNRLQGACVCRVVIHGNARSGQRPHLETGYYDVELLSLELSNNFNGRIQNRETNL